MRMLARLGIAALVTVAALAATQQPVAAQTVLVNGTFSKPDMGPGEYSYGRYFAGNTIIEGWRITEGSVEVYSSKLAKTSNGLQSLELNGAGPGAVEQAMPTLRGATYRVDFRVAKDTWTGAWPCDKLSVDQVMYAQVDGNEATRITYTAKQGNQDPLGTWYGAYYQFQATRGETRLQFGSLTHDPGKAWCGPQIADVQVTRVR